MHTERLGVVSTFIALLALACGRSAISDALRARGGRYVRAVRYRGHLLCQQRVDLLVAESLVLEAKAVEILAPVHAAQVLSYLRVAELRLGLLVNCNVAILRQGIRRVVL